MKSENRLNIFFILLNSKLEQIQFNSQSILAIFFFKQMFLFLEYYDAEHVDGQKLL